MKHYQIINLILLVVWSGCGTNDTGESTIRILIPESPPVMMNYLSPKKPIKGWSSDFPTSTAELNCFAVFTAFEDEGFPVNECKDTNGVIVSRPVFVDGMVPAGSEIRVPVPSGPARTFQVIAFKKDPTLPYCPFVGGITDAEESLLSPPLLIGSTTVDLVPGIQEVTIDASLANAVVLSTCQGPFFSGDFNTDNPDDGPSLPLVPDGGRYDFGDVTPFTDSSPLELQFVNDTGITLRNCGPPVMTGRDPGAYRIDFDDCPLDQPPGTSCRARIVANPLGSATYVASVERFCDEQIWKSDKDSLVVRGTGGVAANWDIVSSGLAVQTGNSILAIDGPVPSNGTIVKINGADCITVELSINSAIDCLTPAFTTGEIGNEYDIQIWDGGVPIHTFSGPDKIKIVSDNWGDGNDGSYQATSNVDVSSDTFVVHSETKVISAMSNIISVISEPDDGGFSLVEISPGISETDNPIRFEVGDEVMVHVSGKRGDGCDGTASKIEAGDFETGRVIAIDYPGNKLRIKKQLFSMNTALSDAFTNLGAVPTATHFCRMQVVRIPNFRTLTFDSGVVMTTSGYSHGSGTTGYGGILTFAVADLMDSATANGTYTLDVSGKGYAGGSQGDFGSSQTGDSNGDGNGGSPAAITPLAAGGGSSYASGGLGQSGGTPGTPSSAACTIDAGCARFGGGGGGGVDGGGSGAASGGTGGGVVAVFAKSIHDDLKVFANGAEPSSTSCSVCNGAGGGAGGQVLLIANNIGGLTNTTSIEARGSIAQHSGASFDGGDGGGGYAFFEFCTTPTISDPTVITGGNAGSDGAPGSDGVSVFGQNASYCN